MGFEFLSQSGVPHDVNGESKTFYPLSVDLVFQLRNMARPLLHAVSILFQDTSSDIGSRRVDSPKGESMLELEAIHPDLAKQRAQQREKAIDRLVDAFFEEKTKWVIMAIILDSLREDFTERPVTQAKAKAFMDQNELSLPVLVELLQGVAKANKAVLDPLGLSDLKKVADRQGLLRMLQAEPGEASSTK